MNVHCFYHRTDLDGHCSGAIVREWCRRNGHAFVPHGVNYGEAADWSAGAGPDSMAVIVDFTPEGPDAAEILLNVLEWHQYGLIWIDHHKTAFDAVGEPEPNIRIRGSRQIGKGACELTWCHFFPDETLPAAVDWLSKYDVLDRSDLLTWNCWILTFQYGMKMRLTDPGNAHTELLWSELFGDRYEKNRRFAETVAQDGVIALQFDRANCANTARSAAYDCTFDGLLCCALNSGNSLAFDTAKRPDHKMLILWSFTGGKWVFSLYENGHAEIDCGEIAKRYGGGGHRGAARFNMPATAIGSPLALVTPQELAKMWKTDENNR